VLTTYARVVGRDVAVGAALLAGPPPRPVVVPGLAVCPEVVGSPLRPGRAEARLLAAGAPDDLGAELARLLASGEAAPSALLLGAAGPPHAASRRARDAAPAVSTPVWRARMRSPRGKAKGWVKRR
jgi:hypothetical protein